MSLGRRTRGRRNSWVIQIHLSFSFSPPHFRPALLPFLRCDQEVGPPCPCRGAENPSPKPRARTVHSSKAWPSPARDGTPWTNEPGVWCGRTARVTSPHTGEGIFTYYWPSRHIKRTAFKYKERESVCCSGFEILSDNAGVFSFESAGHVFCQQIFYQLFFPPIKAIKLIYNEQHWVSLSPLDIFIAIHHM